MKTCRDGESESEEEEEEEEKQESDKEYPCVDETESDDDDDTMRWMGSMSRTWSAATRTATRFLYSANCARAAAATSAAVLGRGTRG